jgi:hypothetical protein
MTDERIKIWVDLGKWAVVSVGLVIMTKIIDTGFKDREVGLNEIKEYDKYVSIVTDFNKIAERRLLAQYFANITPSDKLKEGWQDYFKAVDSEYQNLIIEKQKKQEELNQKIMFDTSAISSEVINQLQSEIKEIENELTPTFKKEQVKNDYNFAIYWEEIGFESLIKRDLDNAIVAFGRAEKAYNTFHQVYEIERYLKDKKEAGESQTDKFWEEVYKNILTDYSWKMPENAKRQLEKMIK